MSSLTKVFFRAIILLFPCPFSQFLFYFRFFSWTQSPSRNSYGATTPKTGFLRRFFLYISLSLLSFCAWVLTIVISFSSITMACLLINVWEDIASFLIFGNLFETVLIVTFCLGKKRYKAWPCYNWLIDWLKTCLVVVMLRVSRSNHPSW